MNDYLIKLIGLLEEGMSIEIKENPEHGVIVIVNAPIEEDPRAFYKIEISPDELERQPYNFNRDFFRKISVAVSTLKKPKQ